MNAKKLKDRTRKTVHLDAFYDIETSPAGEFVVGGITYVDGTYREFNWFQEREFVDVILSVPPTLEGSNRAHVWAHNGGAFDHKWFIDWLIKLGLAEIEESGTPPPIRIIAAGSKMISAQTAGIILYDSKALAKLSLDDFTKGLAVAKDKLKLPCKKLKDCEPDCEGYCRIKRYMANHMLTRVREYLRADCDSGMGAMLRLIGYAEENDLDLCPTVGASAWANASRWLNLPDAELTPDEFKFARLGYFGGRVFVGSPFSMGCLSYVGADESDVSSMYPSRLAFCAVPVGPARRVWGRDAQAAFDLGQPGIYRASVDVPPMHLPPLPIRTKQRIAYPVGKFTGTWARPELDLAREIGVTICKIESAIVWDKAEIVFRPWVEKLFALRDGAPGGKKSALGTFLKFYLNSLTGKFGTRADRERVVVFPDEIKSCPCDGNCERGKKCACKGKCRGGCQGWCGRYRPLGNATDTQIYAAPTWQISPCAHVEWAAYLTSEARCEWLRQALSMGNGGKDVIYGDTDSLFTLLGRTRNAGKDTLGLWGSEGTWQNMRIVAPKVYTYERGGKTVVKAKGIWLPRGADKGLTDPSLIARALESITPTELDLRDGRLKSPATKALGLVKGFWSGANDGKFFEYKNASRRVSHSFGDRLLDEGEEFTRAPWAHELRLTA